MRWKMVRSPIYTGFVCLERKHLLMQELWAYSFCDVYNFPHTFGFKPSAKPSPQEPPQSLVTPPAPAAAPILVAPNATPVISRLYSSLLPLQEVPNGELGPMQVHVPFPFQDLRQIELNLGSFTEDSDNYRVYLNLLKWHGRMLCPS